MSKVKQQEIERLIELVGGRDNIATVTHCITRLRFVLNNPANADPRAIETLPMVKGCFTNAGQFQVVIGTNVGDYYQALIATTGHRSANKEQAKQAARANMKWHEQLISHFAEIFFPLLPALISGGLILGFRNGTRCSGVTTISRALCRALVTKANCASRQRKCWRWCYTVCRVRPISTRAKSWA